MMRIEMRTKEGLLWIDPLYILTEGTDVELRVEFSDEWRGENVTAVFRREGSEERVEGTGGIFRVPRSMVAPAKFTVAFEEPIDDGIVTTKALEIYVGTTLKGEQWT